MQSVLIVIHILVVLALVIVVLLQLPEGSSGLGGGGGTSSFMTGRAQANALSRATAILATMFFVLALLMSIIASWGRAPKSIMDASAPGSATSAPVTADGKPAPSSNLLDQLKGANPLIKPDAPAAPQSPTQSESKK